MKTRTRFGLMLIILLCFSPPTIANITNCTSAIHTKRVAKLPQHLITTYTGILVDIAGGLMVNLNGTCTISATGNSSYTFTFSNGIPSIRGVRFSKDDDTYTVASIMGSNASGIVLDDEDLTIGMVKGNRGQTFSFTGSIDEVYETEDTAYEHHEQHIPHVYNDHHISYDCNTPGITALPTKALGIYTGPLQCSTYGSEPEGVSNLIKVGCNTYRIEFSNGLPPIDYIQFKDDGYGDYIAVRIHGDYATGITVDAKFGDLEIDPKCNDQHISFNGEK